MKKIIGLKVLFLITLLMSFTACEQEEDTYLEYDYVIAEKIIGRTWIGDLGFDFGKYPVESGLKFKPNGFATDEQYYFNNGGFAVSLPVRWKLNNGALLLDYGNGYPLLEIVDIDIRGSELKGMLFVNGYNDGPITLYMDY